MPGQKYCAALWCNNVTNIRVDKQISFFSFPKDPARADQWARFCLRTDLVGRQWQLGKKSCFYVCSEHFTEGDMKRKYPVPLLRDGVIPSIVEVEMPKESSAPEASVTEPVTVTSSQSNASAVQINTPNAVATTMEIAGSDCSVGTEPGVPHTPKRDRSVGTDTFGRSNPTPRTHRKLVGLKARLAMLRSRARRQLKQSKAKRREEEVRGIISSSSKYLPPTSHMLFTTQLQLSQMAKLKRRWPQKFKDLALSLYYHGPKAYRFLQKVLLLPSIRTLQRWQREMSVHPGVNEHVLAVMKEKAGSLDDRGRLVAIMFDEIAIKSQVEYNDAIDQVVGLCHDKFHPKPVVGTNCLAVMVAGIVQNWKQCIGYWVTHSSTSVHALRAIVEECITAVTDTGYMVKVLICDQGPHNQSLCRILGVSPDRPYFEFNGERVVFMYDPPHLLKSMRNNLLGHDLVFEGNIVKWQHVRDLYELQSSLKCRMIPKITSAHIEPGPWKKMRVKLASQVFSETVSIALEAFVAMGKLSSAAVFSSVFIEFMDKLFDCFNSQKVDSHGPKYRGPISLGTKHIPFLKSACAKLSSCHFLRTSSHTRQPPCVQGWVISIKALLFLLRDLEESFSIGQLFTRVLNQDALENMFSKVRQQHGCNDNPTALQFERGLRHIMLSSLSKLSPLSNCESDISESLVRVSESAGLFLNAFVRRKIACNVQSFNREHTMNIVACRQNRKMKKMKVI